MKAQSALDFIVKWGWALLALAVAVGILYYYNVFSSSTYIGSECTIDNQLRCIDFIINTTGHGALSLENKLGQDIYGVKLNYEIFDNLIQNGDFEIDSNSDGIPDDWVVDQADITPNLDSNTYHSGSKSVYFNSPDVDGIGSTIKPDDCIPLTPGDTLKLSVWAKGKNIIADSTFTYQRLYLIGRFYTDSSCTPGNEITTGCLPDIGSMPFTTSSPGATFDWGYYENICVVPSISQGYASDAHSFKFTKVGIHANGQGEGWLDDLRVEVIKGCNSGAISKIRDNGVALINFSGCPRYASGTKYEDDFIISYQLGGSSIVYTKSGHLLTRIEGKDIPATTTTTTTSTTTTLDLLFPRFAQVKTNLTPIFSNKRVAIKHNINWTDNILLSFSIFETNISGAYKNFTFKLLSKNSFMNITNKTSTIKGKYYWRYFANDSSSNLNKTSQFYKIIINSLPTHNNPILNSSLGFNTTSEDLRAYPNSTRDLDTDNVVNMFVWYINNKRNNLLYLSFEPNGSQTSATPDYSKSKHPARVSGVAFWNNASCKLGACYNFNGTYRNQNMTIALSNDFDSLEVNMTMEVWFYPKQYSRAPRLVAFQGGRAEIIQTSTNRINAFIYNGTSPSCFVSGTTTFTLNAWHHAAYTYTSRNNGNISLFLDGNYEGSTVGPTNKCANRIANLQSNKIDIGKRDALGIVFNGTIDEVRLYNITLTPAQIKKHAQLNYSRIDSSMTKTGESWKVEVTPNDGTSNGASKNSTALTILP